MQSSKNDRCSDDVTEDPSQMKRDQQTLPMAKCGVFEVACKQPLESSTCGMLSASCGDFNIHRRTHTGGRIYPCQTCAKSVTGSTSSSRSAGSIKSLVHQFPHQKSPCDIAPEKKLDCRVCWNTGLPDLLIGICITGTARRILI